MLASTMLQPMLSLVMQIWMYPYACLVLQTLKSYVLDHGGSNAEVRHAVAGTLLPATALGAILIVKMWLHTRV